MSTDHAGAKCGSRMLQNNNDSVKPATEKELFVAKVLASGCCLVYTPSRLEEFRLRVVG